MGEADFLPNRSLPKDVVGPYLCGVSVKLNKDGHWFSLLPVWVQGLSARLDVFVSLLVVISQSTGTYSTSV